MCKAKAFLKFGKKEFLRDINEGLLYCSNARTFWDIEDKLKIKGQGDVLEASTRIFAESMLMINPVSNESITIMGKSNGHIRVEPASKIPIFCLFAAYEDDIEFAQNGKIINMLSAEKKKAIQEHFPNADGVIVIDNPEEFINDVCDSIGIDIETGFVQYFNIENGINIDGKTVMDYRYLKYLTQASISSEENGIKHYKIYEDDAYRFLFAKDIFFKDEQEYRMVFPKNEILEGTKFPVILSKKYDVIDLNDFWDSYCK